MCNRKTVLIAVRGRVEHKKHLWQRAQRKLAEATLADDSLAVARALADNTSEGYY